MSRLTHRERRDKQRRSTPTAKRRRARTTKMRLLRIKEGTRRRKIHDAPEPKTVKHKARVPGTVRSTRMPGGSGFRNHWQPEKMV